MISGNASVQKAIVVEIGLWLDLDFQGLSEKNKMETYQVLGIDGPHFLGNT
jgi:hypothetical protein